jgi:hypothetical protein
MRNRLVLAIVAASTLALVLGTAPARAEDDHPMPVTHIEYGRRLVTPIDSTTGTANDAQYKNAPNPICTQTWSSGAVHRTDCEGVAPDNETSIDIDPTNSNRILAAGNDYQLATSGGGTVNETAYTRAQVSTDGGSTWVSHPIPYNGYYSTGDPSVAWDANGTGYVATLGFVWSQGGPTGTNADILVSHSTNHGSSWSTPSKVATGSGSWGSPGVFNDKEMITAWGNGNAIVTWSHFVQGKGGSYIESPIYASVTHDGGNTWTAGVEISGTASFCAGGGAGPANECDQSQGSWPVVAADGSIYVYFLTNDPNSPDFDDQVMVVKVSPATGQRVGGPWRVSGIQDGENDYAISAFGDVTLHDSQFRVPSYGNIAADPTDARHLAVTWMDLRNSPSRDQGDFENGVYQDPYTTATNADIMVSQSWDGGHTWSAPVPVGQNHARDQFFGSAAFLSDGTLVVGMNDRSYDSANNRFAYSLSKMTSTGWSTTNVSGALSNPTKNNRWFSSGLATTFPNFPYPTTFVGDYTTIAASGMVVRPLWTDLRHSVTFAGRGGFDQQLMTMRKAY